MNERQIDQLIQFYAMIQELLVEIAEAPTTSPKTLTKLATLTDGWIVGCVGMNPNTPSHIIEKRLEQLCGVGGCEDESRIHMVGNPALRLQVVRRLAMKDPSADVRDMAGMILAKRMGARSKTTASQLWEIFTLVIENGKAVGAEFRLKIAKDALFSHPNFPHNKLQSKGTDPKKSLRKR